MDVPLELQEANTRAYDLEQEIMRLELKFNWYVDRVRQLEHDLAMCKESASIDAGTCEACGQKIQQRPGGRKKKYCSPACKQENYRTRLLFKT